ncbi:hypothetical protein AB0933_22125 [Streptomyces venezuelae]|uniref:hypothetical protein n=1 Tax=Streptomyces venezuelae TaxID=54571 RepID=UPI0034515EED
MSPRGTALAPTTLLAAVVVALLLMVGAHAPPSLASRPATRIAPVAQAAAQNTATLETTTQAADDPNFFITSFTCRANRLQEGPGQITCTAQWVGGTPIFDPTFRANPGGSNPVTNSNNANRTATFTFGCIRSREYTVTLFIEDSRDVRTPPQTRPYIPCGNF